MYTPLHLFPATYNEPAVGRSLVDTISRISISFSAKPIMLSVTSLPLLALLASTATAASGTASFYGGNTQGGMCSFSSYTIPSNLFGTAMSSAFWEGSKSCGACVEVTGPSNNKIIAMVSQWKHSQPPKSQHLIQVVDQCPSGCDGHALDLFQNGFVRLADISKGIINVNWRFVDCPITSPLQVRMKEGVSAYWFSAQAVNANKVSDLCSSFSGISGSRSFIDSVLQTCRLARMAAPHGKEDFSAWTTTFFSSLLGLVRPVSRSR